MTTGRVNRQRRGPSLRVLHLLAMGLLCPVFLGAQESSESAHIVEELFLSETVFPQERDELQVRVLGAGRGGSWPAQLSIEYGFTDNIQMELAVERSSWQAGPVVADLGLQRSFLSVTPLKLHAAVSFEVEMSPSEGTSEQSIWLVAAKDLAWLGGAHVFAGSGFVVHRAGESTSPEAAEPEVHEARASWFTGLVVAPNQRFRITNEFNYLRPEYPWNEGASRLHWTPGVVWRIPHWGEAGAALSVPLHGPARKVWLTLSFVTEFDAIFRRGDR